jgi:hypothetical protein
MAIGRGAAVVALAAALAGCGGSGDALPRAVQTFERQLEAPRGVLHVVTEELRVVPEPYTPDLPPLGWIDEVSLDLGGSGWRAHRTTGDGGFLQVADERGVRTYTRAGLVDLDSAEGEPPDFLMRPWRAGIVVDPVSLVREGRLRMVGEAEVEGRAAYLVMVDPDPSLQTRLFVAQDDGELLRITHRTERRGRLRMVVQDYAVFEVAAPRPRTLAELIGRG